MKRSGRRQIGEHTYYSYLEYATKAKAQQEAALWRKRGLGARVFKLGSDWMLFLTREPIHKKGRKI